ncbi:uncharacterized protein K441DRAFT_349049 [Cenococcum geophilum 1.58]|uniref:Uncharacterized protein n=1 Tax=Cenococcum geophilum 1.58 TaxID=794803 RepID=A0ACC8EN84_9PEZI|nr:hypothetical protein K441DRAFT_349049 [Cenococcum geophilum 1.58]
MLRKASSEGGNSGYGSWKARRVGKAGGPSDSRAREADSTRRNTEQKPRRRSKDLIRSALNLDQIAKREHHLPVSPFASSQTPRASPHQRPEPQKEAQPSKPTTTKPLDLPPSPLLKRPPPPSTRHRNHTSHPHLSSTAPPKPHQTQPSPRKEKSLEIHPSPYHPTHVRPPAHARDAARLPPPHAAPALQRPTATCSVSKNARCSAQSRQARGRAGAGSGMPSAAGRGDGLVQTRVGPRAAGLAGWQGRRRTCGAGAFWRGERVMPGSVELVLLRDVEFRVREGWRCGGAEVERYSIFRVEEARCRDAQSLFSEGKGVVELKDSDKGRRRK